ncbi:MAG: AAA family ATPase [Candidatus Acetothermia bacterium]
MKKLTLDSLVLNNFKGVKHIEIDFDGKNMDVFGANESGKTTIFDAFTWLLFGQDSRGRAKFDLKTRDESGEVIHHLDHEVVGNLYVEEDGEVRTVELRKVYKEKWTKKRGQADQEFSGHTTDHYIDGVPVKKKEYEELIGGLVDEERFKLLTNPLYFSTQLAWKKRRKILMEMVDPPDYREVADFAGRDFGELLDDVGERGVDGYVRMLKGKIKKINDELDVLPERIDEAERAKPDVSGKREGLEEKLDGLTERKEKLEDDIAGAKAADERTKIRGKISDLETEMADVKRDYQGKIKDEAYGVKDEISRAEADVEEKRRKVKSKKQQIDVLQERIADLADEVGRLSEKRKKKQGKVFGRDQKVCPACGQALPGEQVEKLREKFNADKSKELKKIDAAAAEKRKKIKGSREEIAGLEGEIADINNETRAKKAEIADEKSRLEELRDRFSGYKERDDYRNLADDKRRLEEKLETKTAGAPEVGPLEDELDGIEAGIDSLKDSLSRLEARDRAEKRIGELKERQKKLSAALEDYENRIYLAEEFTRARYGLVEEKINGMFELVDFTLFRRQVNGGIKEVCEASYKGVPFGAVNDAGKVQVGLDIINTLQEHYDAAAPVFVDNREGVTDIPETGAQVVSFYVDPDYSELEFEEIADVRERKEKEVSYVV